MQRSESRILTTHVGSLPRQAVLRDLLIQHERGAAIDREALTREADAAVQTVIEKQVEAGIDIINNGEQPRVGFSTYVVQRMSGFGGEAQRPTALDLEAFPDFAAKLQESRRHASRITYTAQAIDEIRYEDLGEARRECESFLRYSEAKAGAFTERFITAASPGIIATTMLNAYYDTHDNYVYALARQMQKEYELIHAQGLLLQIDCPDLAMERTRLFKHDSLSQFQARVALHIDAINQAVANIPADRIRLHVCWGNHDGPHNYDVPLADILPLLYDAKVGALSIELANPRHQHEYKLFRKYPLPETMLLLPGVIDSTVNYIEHPEVVADRICQVVEAVGDRSRVIASTDCGFGTFAGSEAVAPSVVWAKLRTLCEGADLATSRLWN
ncbi:cobalamin-independent methionine synthase II family protein [Candidatus Entotheonella palauensis]|uniref:cobalamin-independent methionine synthase II family protein n=1 Tax=Candidatus Entotheonella palauensis TaxID=93172 RepID=UPI000B7F3107|nr:cobalamin-independent methionine synthase II family protein [Candidatus Entotheonella palauensis]